MTDDINQDRLTLRRRLRLDGRPGQALAAILLLGLGAAGGAGAVSATRPGVEMAPAQPVTIASLASRTGIVTVRGRVAEIYGGRFTIQDGSGRTLVDAGPRTPDGAVTAGAEVTVQGRFDDGVLRASFLIGADGNVTPLGPPHGPHHGPGPRGDGPPPVCGPEGAPPPPPPARLRGRVRRCRPRPRRLAGGVQRRRSCAAVSAVAPFCAKAKGSRATRRRGRIDSPPRRANIRLFFKESPHGRLCRRAHDPL